MLQFFSAFVAEDGIRDIFIAAIGTGLRLHLCFHRVPTARTKFGTGREIFIASGTLIENKLLVAALGTEFSVDWN